MTLKTQFDIDQKVYIIELKRWGRVVGIWVGRNSIEYQVRFFDNADIKTVYFYENEISKIEVKQELGYGGNSEI